MNFSDFVNAANSYHSKLVNGNGVLVVGGGETSGTVGPHQVTVKELSSGEKADADRTRNALTEALTSKFKDLGMPNLPDVILKKLDAIQTNGKLTVDDVRELDGKVRNWTGNKMVDRFNQRIAQLLGDDKATHEDKMRLVIPKGSGIACRLEELAKAEDPQTAMEDYFEKTFGTEGKPSEFAQQLKEIATSGDLLSLRRLKAYDALMRHEWRPSRPGVDISFVDAAVVKLALAQMKVSIQRNQALEEYEDEEFNFEDSKEPLADADTYAKVKWILTRIADEPEKLQRLASALKKGDLHEINGLNMQLGVKYRYYSSEAFDDLMNSWSYDQFSQAVAGGNGLNMTKRYGQQFTACFMNYIAQHTGNQPIRIENGNPVYAEKKEGWLDNPDYRELLLEVVDTMKNKLHYDEFGHSDGTSEKSVKALNNYWAERENDALEAGETLKPKIERDLYGSHGLDEFRSAFNRKRDGSFSHSVSSTKGWLTFDPKPVGKPGSKEGSVQPRLVSVNRHFGGDVRFAPKEDYLLRLHLLDAFRSAGAPAKFLNDAARQLGINPPSDARVNPLPRKLVKSLIMAFDKLQMPEPPATSRTSSKQSNPVLHTQAKSLSVRTVKVAEKTEMSSVAPSKQKPVAPPVAQKSVEASAPTREDVMLFVTVLLGDLSDAENNRNERANNRNERESVFEGLRMNLQPYFRGNAYDRKTGTCDMARLEKASLGGNTILSAEEIKKAKEVLVRGGLKVESHCNAIVGLLPYLPDSVAGLVINASDDDAGHVVSMLKGIAGDLGLLREERQRVEIEPYEGEVPSFDVGTEGDLRKPGGSNSIPEMFGNEIESITDNPGGGDCFFYSVLPFLPNANGNSIDQATHLRQALHKHEVDLLERKKANPNGGGLVSNDTSWLIPTTYGNMYVNEAANQALKLKQGVGARGMEEKGVEVDVTHGAFLADMLKRPVIIFSNEMQMTYHFDCELESGKRLTGDPIYICHTKGHFRTCQPKPELVGSW